MSEMGEQGHLNGTKWYKMEQDLSFLRQNEFY
jgi:hypothetical protein